VQYISLAGLDMSLLERCDHTTYRPYKGDCAYYSIAIGGEVSRNAAGGTKSPMTRSGKSMGTSSFKPIGWTR
jgi:uncharacterized protein (DUF427 family)